MIHIQMSSQGRYVVTFSLPAGIKAERVGLVGDFEDAPWNPEGFPMRRDSQGHWQVSLELPARQCYEFRFLVNGCLWVNDDTCPMVPNGFGSFNSQLRLEPRWLEAHIRKPLVTVTHAPQTHHPLALPSPATMSWTEPRVTHADAGVQISASSTTRP